MLAALVLAILCIAQAVFIRRALEQRDDARKDRDKAWKDIEETKDIRKTAVSALNNLQRRYASTQAAQEAARKELERAGQECAAVRSQNALLRSLCENAIMRGELPLHVQKAVLRNIETELGKPVPVAMSAEEIRDYMARTAVEQSRRPGGDA